MAKILVIGGSGYIGRALSSLMNTRNIAHVVTQRNEPLTFNYFDLAAPNLNGELLAQPYDSVIFLAAMTDIAQCQKNPELAHRLNVEHTLALLRHFSSLGVYSIFLSTNQVFSCQQPMVHWQQSFQPCSYYGQLKAEVEKAIQTEKLNVGVLRPTKVIGANFPLFNDWYQLLSEGRKIEAFDDHFIAPIPLSYLCQQILTMAELKQNITVQLSGNRDLSYWQLAKFFADYFTFELVDIGAVSAQSKGVDALAYGSLEPCFGANIANVAAVAINSVIEDFQRGICA